MTLSGRTLLQIIAIVAIFGSTSCDRFRESFRDNSIATQPDPTTLTSPHLAFGNPSKATSDTSNKDNYLLVGDGSTFSYNNSRGTVNWVSWLTTNDDLGDSIERPDFRPDPRLPNGFKRIVHSDYSGSGYDRGHMVPSADRFADPQLNEETFMMTNIVPQTAALNQEPWNRFEQYARSQARKFDVYQIAGAYGDNGILKNKVVVPTNCWKIIMLLPRGTGPDSIDERTRIIAVDMPNIDGIENDSWRKYATSIRAIEAKTGYDLLNFLPRDLQDKIETRVEIQNR